MKLQTAYEYITEMTRPEKLDKEYNILSNTTRACLNSGLVCLSDLLKQYQQDFKDNREKNLTDFYTSAKVVRLFSNEFGIDLINNSQSTIKILKENYLYLTKGKGKYKQVYCHPFIFECVREWLYREDIKSVYRFEDELGLMLEKILNNICTIEPQRAVLNYRIDFYIPDYKIAVEYDEKHHKTQIKADKERENDIKKVLGCEFVRIKQGEELEGVNKVLVEVLKKGR